ncbi:hypothetical protein M0R45_011362 [Rubus argutus]|uniref:MADS-box domain-containing protein n=1 Tax=Rubus argutus TaxID=59490 RepID=A0AAW1YDU3_RUBAR
MARRKVRLSFITNDGSRKSTFKKRKKGIIKKVSEITTLCDIKAAAIIYSPYDSQPEVWPNPTAAHSLLTRFQNMPEMEKSRKMVDQETYLKQRIAKVREQIRKLQKENREKEVTRVMFDCLKGRTLQDLQLRDLNDLGWVIDRHLREIEVRKRDIKEEDKEDRKHGQLNQVKAAQMETAAAERGAGVMRMSAYEEGSSQMQVQVQVKQQQPLQLAAMEAQTLEQLQIMQIAANRQQAHQNPWFVDIMNPPPPPAGLPDQTMGFMHPPPQPFGDYNSHSAMWSNNFRFP